ncbi:IS110 family transposase, partial [Micromonospora sp. NPDC048843]|uniref:IS110 family transposase n=1 Tax=Micromonospora sp. NPDC048843 TaxID=3155389 RepID=UPI0033DC3F5A
MTVYCGIDWAEEHHDVAIVDDSAGLVARLRIGDDAAGYRQLIDLLADAGDNPQQPIPVAIETSRGLLVACLRATGRQIYAINPVAVARYRDRYTVSRTKSDHVDAVVLANILRTDMAVHRPLPNDSELILQRQLVRGSRVVGSGRFGLGVGVVGAIGTRP